MVKDFKIDHGTYRRYALKKWNTKLYFNSPRGVDHKLWKKFGIRSAPEHKDACWSHIPFKWEDDVRIMLKATRDELGDKIEFKQIKEKFCHLTVYFIAKDDVASERMTELIKQCKDRLISKDIHPHKRL